MAPTDLRAGGTWLGVNRFGVFAGITNRATAQPDPSRRSRGMLVIEALQAETAADAARAFERLPASAYNGFNLFVSDSRNAYCIVYDRSAAVTALDPGVHVVGNADPDDSRVPKIARLQEEAAHATRVSAERLLEEFAGICRSHEPGTNPLEQTCIHTEAYGTRSSTLLRLGDSSESDALLYADGSPCRTPYEDLTPLLHELRRKDGVGTGRAAMRKAS